MMNKETSPLLLVMKLYLKIKIDLRQELKSKHVISEQKFVQILLTLKTGSVTMNGGINSCFVPASLKYSKTGQKICLVFGLLIRRLNIRTLIVHGVSCIITVLPPVLLESFVELPSELLLPLWQSHSQPEWPMDGCNKCWSTSQEK
jgi:hypothetical protein